MAHDLPYVNAYGKIGQLFERVSKAKIPDAFTVKFLNDSIGLKSTSDRTLISLLKRLGFLDSSGKPTNEYAKLKNKDDRKCSNSEGHQTGLCSALCGQ